MIADTSFGTGTDGAVKALEAERDRLTECLKSAEGLIARLATQHDKNQKRIEVDGCDDCPLEHDTACFIGHRYVETTRDLEPITPDWCPLRNGGSVLVVGK
jgi:hypothetical protein